MGLNVTLPPEQQQWLEAQVVAGHFASLDEAAAVAVADLMAIGSDDLAWAKPYVDAARASTARGVGRGVFQATFAIENLNPLTPPRSRIFDTGRELQGRHRSECGGILFSSDCD